MQHPFLKRRSIAALLAILCTVSLVPFSIFAQASPINLVGEIELNPQTHYQTLDGWGSSLCWWGNVIGSVGETDTNHNGKPDREEIAELAFSPEFLNLNIVRYNVGGGDKSNSSIKRIEGRVPGWSKDMFGAEDGSGKFLGDAFYNKNSIQMNDAGQIWMLEQANKWRKASGDIINLVFANSPPYYMTKSGSSTGGYDNDKENLKADCYDDFALYLARAAKWLNQDLKAKYGSEINYVEPLNEPDTNYWINGSTKQEGCIFWPGNSQIKAYQEMRKALQAENLNSIKLTGTDETGLYSALNSFKRLDADTRKNLSVISAHTYSGSDSERIDLRKTAASYDKGLWMSEVTRGGDGHSANSHHSMWSTNTKAQSEGIMADLKKMQSSAWIAWLVADSEYECIQTNSNWGLIHYVFEKNGPVKGYHNNLFDGNGNVKQDIPTAGYWAVTKQFYTMMQYSKFLKAGYTMVDIGDDNMCAAISPDRNELVIVAQNFGSDERSTSVDLHHLPNAAHVQLYRTSNTESCKAISTKALSSKVLNVSLPNYSVSTYIITADGNDPLYDSTGYKKVVGCDVQTSADTAASGASDKNKFTYSSGWNNGWGIQEKYTSQKNATATFKFTGTQAVLYGKKSTHGANLLFTVDGGESVPISTYASKEARRSMLFTTPLLKEGEHTVKVAMAESQTVSSPEIVLEYAEILNGDIAANVPRITNIASHNNALTVQFDNVENDLNYTVECGISKDKMTVSAPAKNAIGILTGLANGTQYYVRVKSSDDRFSYFETATPAAPRENLCYFVNAGTNRLYSPATGGSFGCYNSVMDQTYGKDAVTGKSWGYIGDKVYAHSGSDTSVWDSLRHDEQNTVGQGITYEFQLDPGVYFVQVGMQDPWKNNDRKQDLVIQGELKDTLVPNTQTIKKYTIPVTSEDGNKLTIQAARSAGVTGGDNDPLVNWIQIEKAAKDDLVSFDTIPDCATIKGVVPNLPHTVTCKTPSGQPIEKAVKWEVSAHTFDVNNYSTVTITGNIEGSELKATTNVLVVPQNLQYFVDCNNLNSTTFKKLDKVLDLYNSVPDKEFADGSWGYTEHYGSHPADNGDRFDVGWYAKSNQSIQYKVPLTAGSYELTFGFKEWWSQYRPMKVSASYPSTDGNVVTETLFATTIDGSDIVAPKASFVLPTDALVTFTVAKNQGPEPVLSYFSIQQAIDHTALISSLQQAHTLDRTRYHADSLRTLDNAVQVGSALLTAANTTQTASNNAANAITQALSALNKDSEFTEEALKANDYVLYLANCGTPDAKIVPDGYKLGLMQSCVDQQYAKDSVSGKIWGYAADDANSRMDKNGDNAKDITATCMSMSTNVTFDKYKSGLKYAFALPFRDYEVTLGFKNPWGSRNVNIQLEGKTVKSDLNVNYNQLIEKTYIASVSDGELNVMIHSPHRTNQYGDPIISYIIVKAVPEYTIELLKNTLAEMGSSIEGTHWGEDGFAHFQSARETAKTLIDKNITDVSAIRNAYLALYAAFGELYERVSYTSFSGVDGAPYYDTNGVQIQAHGGQIQKLTIDGETKYYWIGEDKTNDYRPVVGIHLYSSSDLYNWKDEGVVLRTMESMDEFENDPYFKELYGDYSEEKKEKIFIDLDKNRCVIERPKMIYNEKTDKYVIWFHADGLTPQYPESDYAKANAGIAIADKPQGPFKLLGSYDLNYVEGDNQGFDGSDNLGAVRDMNLFVDDDKTGYIIYSSQGNRTTFVSKLNDEYTDLAVPRDEAIEGVHFTKNFEGKSREAPAMFKYNEKYYMINSGCSGWNPNEAQYAIADHPMGPWTVMWSPCEGSDSNNTFHTQSTCVFPVDAKKGKYIYMGDRWNAGDLSESRYVWLPVEFLSGNQLVLKPYSNWTLEELNNKGYITIDTELPKQCSSLAELKDLLPDTIDVTIGTTEIRNAAVEWNKINPDNPFLGDYTLTGTLTEQGKSFDYKVCILNPQTLYFFDCAAYSSDYFDKLQESASGLLNSTPDQAYTSENHAGYKDSDLGNHVGIGLYNNGWWANENKPIEYVFDLAPGEYTVTTGYQEWWSTERGIKISAVIKNSDGSQSELAAKKFTLGKYDYKLAQNLTFTVPKMDEDLRSVIIRVEKTNSPDPVLSFIGLVKNSPSVDFNGLQAVIDLAKDKKETLYTQESWTEFRNKLSAAQTVFDNPNSTQVEIDQAKTDLQKAMDALVFNVTTENLQIIYSEVITLLESKTNNTYSGTPDDDTINGFYSKEAYDALSKKSREAQALLDIINGESNKTPPEDLTDSPDGSGTDNPDGSGTDNPDGSGTDNPEGSSTDNPEGSGTDNPAGSGTDNPAGSGTDNPAGSGTDNPEDSGTDNPEDSERQFIFKINCLGESKLDNLDYSEEENSEDGKPEDGKPEDGKPEDGKPEDGKPEDGKPEDGKPEDGKPEDGKPKDGKPEDGKPEDGKPEDGKPEDGKPEDGKPEDGKPEDGKPEDGKPEDGKPEDGKPEDGKWKETNPTDSPNKNSQPGIQEGTKKDEMKQDMTEEQAASLAAMMESLSKAKETFLSSRYTVDVTLVNRLKTLINSLDGLVKQNYSAESWQAVEHVIANGQSVLDTDGEKFTARAIKNATSEITDALANLKQTSSPSRGKSSSSEDSHMDDEQEFWQDTKEKILSAQSGATLRIMAKRFDKMPVSILRALCGRDLTLKISWSGKEPIIIEGQAVKEIKKGQVYYRLSNLAELYQAEAEISELQTQEPVVSEPLQKQESCTPAETLTPVPEPVTSPQQQEPIPAEQAEKPFESSSIAAEQQESSEESTVPAQTEATLPETPSKKESGLSPLVIVLFVILIAIVSIGYGVTIKNRKLK